MEKYKKILNVLFIVILSILGINLLYYILFACKSVLNSDSAFLVDYSMEQIATGHFFPTNWIESNDFWIYSIIPIMTPLIKLGINLFTSRQISVLIQSIIIFFLIYKLFYNKQDKNAFFITLILIVSGISTQIMFDIFGDASYGSILMYMLLIVYFFVRHIETNSKKFLILIFFGLLILTALSLRFVIFVAAPLIIVLVYFWINKMHEDKIYKLFVTILISSLIGYLFHNVLIEKLIYVSALKNIIVDENELQSSLFATLFDFLYMNGGTARNLYSMTNMINLNITPFSPINAFLFLKCIVCVFNFILPIFLLKNIKKLNDREKIITIYSTSFTIFVSFFMIICGLSFWFKYLSPVIFIQTLLYVYFYKYILKNDRAKGIYILLIIMCAFYSFYTNSLTYYDYNKKELIENKYQGLTNYLLENNLHFGYLENSPYYMVEHNIYNLLSNGGLRIARLNTNNDGPDWWLNSLSWYENNYYSDGPIFYMRKGNEPSQVWECEALDVLSYNGDEDTFYIFIYENDDVIQKYINGGIV